MTRKQNSDRNTTFLNEKNDSLIKLQSINGNALFRNITFVKRVNITDRKEEKDPYVQ